MIADVDTLATLPASELRSGLAEVVKYGVIADAELFERWSVTRSWCCAGEPADLASVVERSCQIKAEVVRQDPQEQGLRAILNYGHTVGHAIEAVLGYGVIPHGAAVSLGMSAAAEISVRLGLLDSRTANRQDRLLRRLGLPKLCFPGRLPTLTLSRPAPPSSCRTRLGWRSGETGPATLGDPVAASELALLSAMALDKKTVGGRLRFVLARSLGAVEVREVPSSMVASVLEAATLC